MKKKNLLILTDDYKFAKLPDKYYDFTTGYIRKTSDDSIIEEIKYPDDLIIIKN